MGREKPVGEKTESAEIGHGCQPLIAEIGHLIVHFARVQRQERAVLLGERLTGPERSLGNGGGAVRGDDGTDAVGGGILLKKVFGEFQAAFFTLAVGRFLGDHGFPEKTAHAGFQTGAGDLVLKVIHVHKGGGARQQHFPNAVLRAEIDELRGQRFVFQGKEEAAEPVGTVISHGAEGYHAGMTVKIDEPGEKNAAAAVDHAVGFGHVPAPDLQNPSALGEHIAVLKGCPLIVHGQYMGMFQKRFQEALSPIRSRTMAQNTSQAFCSTDSSKSKPTVCWALARSVMVRI